MAQLRHHQSELEARNVAVKIIRFDNDVMAALYAQQSDLPWPMLHDANRELYRGYGMLRGSWWAIYRPAVLLQYIRLILKGRRPGPPGSDWRQLGGDVLIDPTGIVRVHFVSEDPHDRPNVPNMLAKIDRANRSAE